ncbi:MAG TPA: tRNA 2-selenouridine(34) synthase MnmH [Bacteroidales bacterium]|nr:tRNA 2-selenouridine(34) synthase MnmH [Bacteroidales bacterium]
MTLTISIEKFIELSDIYPVIDVRSPSEYARGHIPGAFNIPLFSDEERAAVGTKYVKEGRQQAVRLGLELVAPKLNWFVDALNSTVNQKNILVYCWRGGMRSASMSWLFGLAGFKPLTLEGGYKSFRRYAQATFDRKYKFIVLGGMTGCGKTELIKKLKANSEQVVDLEGLANHKGSAFGWINQPKQPTTEHFENLLFNELRKLNPSQPIWIEDESKSIGSIFLPQSIYIQIINSPTIIIETELNHRIERLINDYTVCDKQDLINSVHRIQKQLGLEKAKRCIDYIESGNLRDAIGIALEYYDKTYSYGIAQKKIPPKFLTFDGTANDMISKLKSVSKSIIHPAFLD